MISLCALFLVLFASCSSSSAVTLPFNEVKYEVQLSLDHASAMSENLMGQVDMYSKYGQKFHCYIPDLGNATGLKEIPQLNNTYVASLLGVNNRSACLILRKDWWTYELCPYHHIVQFHEEGEQRVSEILLGKFDSETNWDVTRNLTAQKPLTHRQWYKNGSMCDITFRQRKVEVHYVCAGIGLLRIIKVEEIETCVYRMEISSPELCSHPLFAKEAPSKIEKIMCVPTEPPTSAYTSEKLNHEYKNAGALEATKSHSRRVPNAFADARARRNQTDYRIVKRLMRRFLQSLTDASTLQGAHVGSPDSFTIHVQNSPSHQPFSFSVERSELLQWVREGHRFVADFQSYLELALTAQQANDASLLRSLPIVHSLGTFIASLIKYKQVAASTPGVQPKHPTLRQFVNATQLFRRIYRKLSRKIDSNVVSRLKSDLQAMLGDSEFSVSFADATLDGLGVDGKTRVQLRLPTIQRPQLSLTPIEVSVLVRLSSIIRHQLLVSDELQRSVLGSEQLRQVESAFESTLHHLLNGPQFRVIMVRGIDDKDESAEDHVDSLSDGVGSSSGPRLSQGVLAMVRNILRKVSPEASEGLEVYETENAKGVSTIFIVSGEEKHKEEKRMKKLEDAYKYTGGHHPAPELRNP